MLINHVKEDAKVIFPHAMYESSSHFTLLLVPVIVSLFFFFHFSHWAGTLSHLVLTEVLAYFSMVTKEVNIRFHFLPIQLIGEISLNCLFKIAYE